jgi:RNA-directed DNA polymerase
MIVDKNAYGFRPLRSTADAIEQCFIVLASKNRATYVLEADIKSCFDSINVSWLLENIPMDKKILKQWLEAGYIEKYQWYPTTKGTPQGAIISPTLLNITLSGLEAAAKSATKPKDKINVCVYADDFIITGATQAVLEEKVKPTVERFLKERGLNFSPNKTRITHIEEGFDFLGVNLRKYNGKFISKPAKSNILRFLRDMRAVIKTNGNMKTETLIQILNPKIRGWTNYHRHNCAKRTFNYVDAQIYQMLWQWVKKRHPQKGAKWLCQKYFRSQGMRHWVFSTKCRDDTGKTYYLDLLSAAKTPIIRHIKIRAEATPYEPKYHRYLSERIRRKAKAPPGPNWRAAWWELFSEADIAEFHKEA